MLNSRRYTKTNSMFWKKPAPDIDKTSNLQHLNPVQNSVSRQPIPNNFKK